MYTGTLSESVQPSAQSIIDRAQLRDRIPYTAGPVPYPYRRSLLPSIIRYGYATDATVAPRTRNSRTRNTDGAHP
ncbi:uncharacterized protein SCHCODRAFT_02613716, partial [Schizophyllum commune H4-8]|uniref:uncharacterized protein n=1 Tax=Schizophyllum commune (strain H4-8 / FGSC 9210) TaxID=578458 RepID=UPI00215E80E2